MRCLSRRGSEIGIAMREVQLHESPRAAAPDCATRLPVPSVATSTNRLTHWCEFSSRDSCDASRTNGKRANRQPRLGDVLLTLGGNQSFCTSIRPLVRKRPARFKSLICRQFKSGSAGTPARFPCLSPQTQLREFDGSSGARIESRPPVRISRKAGSWVVAPFCRDRRSWSRVEWTRCDVLTTWREATQ